MKKRNWSMRYCFVFLLFGLSNIQASDYHVGPGQALASISDVPWVSLAAGDRVFIHWRNTSYKEKWVINRQGTANNRIEIIGVNGPNDQQPVIDGDGAITAAGLNYTNEERGVIKIGSSNTPPDGLPSYITIDNLEIRSGRPAYQFIDDHGLVKTYASNCASIYVEKAAHLIIRNCTIHDSGNGIFIGAFNGQTEDVQLEKNYIYDNGIDGSAFQHNTYTNGVGMVYQYNHFGPLRAGADGNNLKDRSAGLVVKYNWIESGNRQLDLVEADDSEVTGQSSYSSTHVYGNILIEPDNAGNSQVAHYGGDGGITNNYRKGDLYFFNNTIISTRSGNTTLIRLSTNEETAHVFNNVIFTTASGGKFAMISGNGVFNMHHNWLKTGWKNCHCTPSGMINDMGSNITGSDPLFVDLNSQDFHLQDLSPLIDKGDTIPSALLPFHNISIEYFKHLGMSGRPIVNNLDLGAYEYGIVFCSEETKFVGGSWTNGVPDLTKSVIIESDYDTSIFGDINACSCKVINGAKLTIADGDVLNVATEMEIEGVLDAVDGSMVFAQN